MLGIGRWSLLRPANHKTHELIALFYSVTFSKEASVGGNKHPAKREHLVGCARALDGFNFCNVIHNAIFTERNIGNPKLFIRRGGEPAGGARRHDGK